MRGAETVELIRLGEPDRWGERPEQAPVAIPGCVLWPRTSTEDDARGVVVIAGLNCFLPPGSPQVSAVDRIRARGGDWEVEGEPGDYRNTSGRAVGVLVTLQKVGVTVA